MPSKKPQFVIRTEKDILAKIAYIGKENERNSTQEIIYLIKQRIKEFESINGNLIVAEDGSVTLAKPQIVKEGKSSSSKIG